jgi:hypothetical protein
MAMSNARRFGDFAVRASMRQRLGNSMSWEVALAASKTSGGVGSAGEFELALVSALAIN